MIGQAIAKFTVQLVDKMSGPAKDATAAVRGLNQELSKSGEGRGGGGLRKQVQQVRQLAGAFGSMNEAAKVLSSGSVSEGLNHLGKSFVEAGQAYGTVGQVIGAIAGTAIMAAGAFEKLGESALRAANEEQVFARQTRAAFEGLAGSKEAGDATYDAIDRLSKRLPIARQELVEWTKDLQAAGVVDPGVLKRGVTALASSKALMGNEGADTLLSTLRRVQEAIDTNHGLKLADRQLSQLGKTGANVNDVAKELNISAQQLQKSLKAPRVGDHGVDAGAFGTALLSAIEKKGRGPLKAMWGDLDTLGIKAKEFALDFFKDVNLEPARDALQDLLNLLDENTNAGKNLGNGVKEGTDLIVKGFAAVTNEVTVAILKVEQFGLDADTTLINVGNRAKTLAEYMKSLPARAASAAMGNTSALDLPTLASDKVDAKKQGFDKLVKDLTPIKLRRAQGVQFGTDGEKVADAIAAGVKNGLIDHAQGVALAGSILGKKAVEGANKGAEVHSPSRATFRTGAFVGAGLELGMRSMGGSVGRAGAYLGSQATRTSLFLGADRDRRGTPGRAGGGGVNIDRAEVNIVAPNGVTDAQEISAWGLAIALERQQLMSGG